MKAQEDLSPQSGPPLLPCLGPSLVPQAPCVQVELGVPGCIALEALSFLGMELMLPPSSLVRPQGV